MSSLRRVIRDVDVTRPNAPTGLAGTPISETAINLSWNAATDPQGSSTEANTGVVGYKLYRNGVLRTTQAGLTFGDSGLSAYTFYSYEVTSYDGAGNESLRSSAVSVRSLDTTLPSAPVITASQSGSTSILVTLSTPSTDAGSGIGSYELNYKRSVDSTWIVDSTLLTAGSFPRSISGLVAGTAYDTRCRARDVATNVGSFSATSSVSTAGAGVTTHPLFWLNQSDVIARLASKASSDPFGDWATVKALADLALGQTMPALTITGASNANPVQFTTAEAIPWSGTEVVFLGGATGGWAGLNTPVYPGYTATKTGTNTFTVPVNSTGFGSFSGQTVRTFMEFSSGFNGGGASSVGAAGNSYQGSGWFDLAFALGVCYRTLGTAGYATKALQLLDYIVSMGLGGIYRPVSTDVWYSTRFTLPTIAMLYDWCNDRLSAQQKSDYATALNFWYDGFNTNKDNPFLATGPADSNYYLGHMAGFGLAAIACAGDNGRSAEILGAVKTSCNTQVVTQGFLAEMRGGNPKESFGYGANAYERFLWFAEALVNSGDSTDYRPYFDCCATALKHTLKPDGWATLDEGDYTSDTRVVRPSYIVTLARNASTPTLKSEIRYLYDHLTSHSGQNTPTMPRLLWLDASQARIDYTTTEALSAFVYDRSYRRSSWSSTAFWSMANHGAKYGASNGDHQSRLAGHVSVQRGSDFILVNAGQWKGTGDGTSGNPTLFARSNGLGNTLFHNDPTSFSGDSYFGGQGFGGSDSILVGAVDNDKNVAYGAASLASAYTGSGLTTYRRATAHFGTGCMATFDYVVRGATSHTDKWPWHFNPNGTLTLPGGGVAKFSLPTSNTYLKPLHLNTPTLVADQVRDNYSGANNSGGTYSQRLTVTDTGSPGTTMRCVQMIYSGATSLSAMPTCNAIVSSGSTYYGASIVDGADTWYPMFPADGVTAQDSISMTLT